MLQEGHLWRGAFEAWHVSMRLLQTVSCMLLHCRQSVAPFTHPCVPPRHANV